jgi:DNA repair exonuclease SbcCD ATPase subunit
VCEALWTNNKLVSLDIRDNRIREKGGIAVGNLLKRNRTLQDINLSGNTITDNSAAVIVEALLQNKVFKRLKLKLNPVGYKYLSEIEHILESNQNTLKKTFKPEIEQKIKQLQIFEEKRDSVLEELENKKKELEKRKKEFRTAFELYEKAKAEELAVTQGVEKELDQCMKRFNKLEEESHYLARDFAE